ncbi:hypothetical protein FHG66_11945 [Rubellimicrobium rubrum]|uniref:Uncharacterized protein n=1 Tax=Rubellimicrobium rubrum TaxID=2585369 RepID=A0A5C4MXK9_9RHOB|nr:hypothetical protein [Rubellimicrobium rubrum]TNC49156.1 hypothetical protein FHG66_11945 [Rubellimicrobium rubrum]
MGEISPQGRSAIILCGGRNSDAFAFQAHIDERIRVNDAGLGVGPVGVALSPESLRARTMNDRNEGLL